MSKEKELEEVSNKLEEISIKRNALEDEEWPLLDQKADLLAAIIITQKILKGTLWEFMLRDDGRAYLHYLAGRFDKGVMEKVHDMVAEGWHCSYQMAPNVRMDFDDNEVRLLSEDTNDLAIFAKEHELVVSTPALDEKVQKVEARLANLKNSLKLFGHE